MGTLVLEAVSTFEQDGAGNVMTIDPLPTRAAGNLLTVWAAVRNVDETVADPTGWDRVFTGANAGYGIWARIATNDANDAFSLDWSGTTANNGQMAVWSGDVPADVTTMVVHSAERSGNFASSIGYPDLTITTDECLVLLCGRKIKTATSDGATVDAEPGFTTIGSIAPNGNNLVMYWGYVMQTTASNIAEDSIQITGTSDSANYRGVLIAIETAAGGGGGSIAPLARYYSMMRNS